jgi:murein DD-endopeptidase MepM/ murein hydrolase activator NlpD
VTLSPVALRRLRIAAAGGLVVVILAGAGALWLAARGSEATPTASSPPARTTTPPPVRLDTLPPRGGGAASPSGPVEDRSAPAAEARTDRPREPDERRGRGDGPGDMRGALAALVDDNGRVQSALGGYGGPEPGTGEIVWPVDGSILFGFGWPSGRQHAGIDIQAPTGTPVHAADWGRVVLAGVVGDYGKLVCLQHTQTLSTCYAHNSRLRVREGDEVGSGDVIARSGCTGSCYAPHLHFEVREDGRPVNPRDYLGAPLSAIG